MPIFSFSRLQRLLKKSHYDYVFQMAKRVTTRSATVLFRKNRVEYPRLGLIVSKKTAKRAHDRNRFKRLTRESFRLTQHELPAFDIIVLSRGKIENIDGAAFVSELEEVWQRMKKQL